VSRRWQKRRPPADASVAYYLVQVYFLAAEVAVSEERTHPEFFREGHGLAVVLFGRVELGGVTMGGDLPEEPEDPRLVSSLLVVMGELEGLFGELDGVFQATRH
jgi:hypothetical protein